MRIYLVRHGEAVSPEVDPERPLSPQGKEAVEKIARRLGEREFPLSRILHSQKLRAKQTAEIMDKYLTPDRDLLKEHPQMMPDDPIEPAFQRAMNEGGDVMMVGHLPYLQRLLGHMVIGNEHIELVRFKEGTVVCVASSRGSWLIEWVFGLQQA